jgi:DNA-binding NtrC family response regulator
MDNDHENSGPRAHENLPAPAQHPVGTEPAEQAIRILILEDDPWDSDLAQRLLRDDGIRFKAVVVDTKEAFAAELDSLRPEVIISDFMLPGFTGADTLRIARERCPEVPYIFWSGVLGDEAAVELIKQGATDYILKDRPARLASAVKRAVTDARQRARLAQIEAQLGQAQSLASTGQLAAAQRAVALTREMIDSARSEMTAHDA